MWKNKPSGFQGCQAAYLQLWLWAQSWSQSWATTCPEPGWLIWWGMGITGEEDWGRLWVGGRKGRDSYMWLRESTGETAQPSPHSCPYTVQPRGPYQHISACSAGSLVYLVMDGSSAQGNLDWLTQTTSLGRGRRKEQRILRCWKTVLWFLQEEYVYWCLLFQKKHS